MSALIASIVVALACCTATFVLAYRADHRFARFERIPWQFGIDGKPTYFGPRRVLFYLMPWLGVALIILMGFSLAFLPANGNPAIAFIAVGLIGLAIQMLLVWLIGRWARDRC